MQPGRDRFHILFVCLGNICRSPAAEIIFRKMAQDHGRAEEFHIDSAGTIGYHEGSQPDARMSATLESHGFTVTGRSRPLRAEDLKSFDLIVTMDESNFEDVRNLDPSGNSHPKIRPMVSYCRAHDDVRVPDPYYGGQRGFEHVVDLLKDASEGMLEEIKTQ